jgi:flagellar basal-body rod protein FlgC
MTMDYNQSFAISAIGMNIERTRVDVAALNLANANTVQGVGGASYQPLRVVAQAQSLVTGGDAAAGAFGALVDQGLDGGAVPMAAPLVQVVASQTPPRLVYEPGHPLADARGYVSYAAVDTATEMVSMMSATRAYEANVSAMNTSRTLALRALDIGSNA